MLPETLTLEVVTPERQLISETVSEVQLPGVDGYLGILPGHAPLLTEVGVGMLTYRKAEDTFFSTAIHGFAEVLPDRVIVLADIAERVEEIDVERARAARERAEKRLARTDAPDTDWNRACAALKRAEIRLQAAAHAGTAASQEERRSAP